MNGKRLPSELRQLELSQVEMPSAGKVCLDKMWAENKPTNKNQPTLLPIGDTGVKRKILDQLLAILAKNEG